MGGVIGSPTPQAQPWAQATQQQAAQQTQQAQQLPRSYYGEVAQSTSSQPNQTGRTPYLPDQDYQSLQAGWQQQAQVPEAPQPVEASQLNAAPGVNPGMQVQRRNQQRTYYGE
jgi:hypothetical protein